MAHTLVGCEVHLALKHNGTERLRAEYLKYSRWGFPVAEIIVF